MSYVACIAKTENEKLMGKWKNSRGKWKAYGDCRERKRENIRGGHDGYCEYLLRVIIFTFWCSVSWKTGKTEIWTKWEKGKGKVRSEITLGLITATSWTWAHIWNVCSKLHKNLRFNSVLAVYSQFWKTDLLTISPNFSAYSLTAEAVSWNKYISLLLSQVLLY